MSVDPTFAITEETAKEAEALALTAKRALLDTSRAIKQLEEDIADTRANRSLGTRATDALFKKSSSLQNMQLALQEKQKGIAALKTDYLTKIHKAQDMRKIIDSDPKNKLKALEATLKEKQSALEIATQDAEEFRKKFRDAMTGSNSLEDDVEAYFNRLIEQGGVSARITYTRQQNITHEIASTRKQMHALQTTIDTKQNALFTLKEEIESLYKIIRGSAPTAFDPTQMSKREQEKQPIKSKIKNEAAAVQTQIHTMINQSKQKIQALEQEQAMLRNTLKGQTAVPENSTEEEVFGLSTFLATQPIEKNAPLTPVILSPTKRSFLTNALEAREHTISLMQLEIDNMEHVLNTMQKKYALEPIISPSVSNTPIPLNGMQIVNNILSTHTTHIADDEISLQGAIQAEKTQALLLHEAITDCKEEMEDFNDIESTLTAIPEKDKKLKTLEIEKLRNQKKEFETRITALETSNPLEAQTIESLTQASSIAAAKRENAQKEMETAQNELERAGQTAAAIEPHKKSELSEANKRADLAYIKDWSATSEFRIAYAEEQQLKLALNTKKTQVTQQKTDTLIQDTEKAIQSHTDAIGQLKFTAKDCEKLVQSLQGVENELRGIEANMAIADAIEIEQSVPLESIVSTPLEKEKAKKELQTKLMEASRLTDDIQQLDGTINHLNAQLEARGKTLWEPGMIHAILETEDAYYDKNMAEHVVQSIKKDIASVQHEIEQLKETNPAISKRQTTPKSPQEAYAQAKEALAVVQKMAERAQKKHDEINVNIKTIEEKIKKVTNDKLKTEEVVIGLTKQFKDSKAVLQGTKNDAIQFVKNYPSEKILLAFKENLKYSQDPEKQALLNELIKAKPQKSLISRLKKTKNLSDAEKQTATNTLQAAFTAITKHREIQQKLEKTEENLSKQTVGLQALKRRQETLLKDQASSELALQATQESLTKAMEIEAKTKQELETSLLVEKAARQKDHERKEPLIKQLNAKIKQWKEALEKSIIKLEKTNQPKDQEKLSAYKNALTQLNTLTPQSITAENLRTSIQTVGTITENLKNITSTSRWKKIRSQGVTLLMGKEAAADINKTKGFFIGRELHKTLEKQMANLEKPEPSALDTPSKTVKQPSR